MAEPRKKKHKRREKTTETTTVVVMRGANECSAATGLGEWGSDENVATKTWEIYRGPSKN